VAWSKLCDILQVPLDQAKHKAGKELVKLFCQPRPANAKLRRATRETHPTEWAQFLAYAGSDIEAMRAIDKRMPVWNYQGFELDLWHLDQRVNDRGFAVDVELAEAPSARSTPSRRACAARRGRTATARSTRPPSATRCSSTSWPNTASPFPT
jgi:DNA polymerase